MIETFKHPPPPTRRWLKFNLLKSAASKIMTFLKHQNTLINTSLKSKNCKIDLYSTCSIRNVCTDYLQSKLYIYVPVFKYNIHLHFSSKLNKLTTPNDVPYTERQHAFIIHVLRLTETKKSLSEIKVKWQFYLKK